MRYAPLPKDYFKTYANALQNAMLYDNAIVTYCETVDSPEQPAVLADFLLRYDKVNWALSAAVYKDYLVYSLRTNDPRRSAADIMRRLMRNSVKVAGIAQKPVARSSSPTARRQKSSAFGRSSGDDSCATFTSPASAVSA